MPDHLKALIVILVLALAAFAFAKVPACAMVSTTENFDRRRKLWFAITVLAFLASNYWVHIVAIALLLFFAQRREPNKLAMFYFLLFAIPPIDQEIPGMGMLGAFFVIHYHRLLLLVVLLPMYLFLRKQPDTERFGRSPADKLFAAFFILHFVLTWRTTTFTESLRTAVFYPFIDYFLPYYVASRSLKNLQEFREVLMAFVVAALVLSLTGVFEYARGWLLYANLDHALGVVWQYGGYLRRGGDLRALGSIGQPIPFGYTIAVAMGFFVFLRKSVPNPQVWHLGMILLTGGIISSLSRGPWVGAAVMLMVFLAVGPSPVLRLTRLAIVGAIVTPPILLSPLGEKILDRLPFIGTIQAENVTYRQQLLEVSIHQIQKNPWFGDRYFMNAPEMVDLTQGQGIIDLVNSYAGIGLADGLIGLGLFLSFFIAVLLLIFKSMRSLPDRNSEMYLLGQTLFSVLVGILAIIATVSSLNVVPIIYWSVAGLGVAYARMVALEKTPAPAPEAARWSRRSTPNTHLIHARRRGPGAP
jgi:O-antigen ligase/polysaccharide polymerase Wzy-like membrane protein